MKHNRHNDEAARGVLQALEENHTRVPHDISLAGFDGLELCELVAPSLSSVEIPLREIGARGRTAAATNQVRRN